MQILFKSLTTFSHCTCHPSRGHAALLLQKKNPVCTCHPCTKDNAIFLCAFFFFEKKVQLIPCRRENRHSCAGSPIISCAFHGRFFRVIRTFGRAVEGSSVSPLTNTMGGLSGGGRGGDTSGVCSAPSFVIAWLRARSLALDLVFGTCCPPFVIWKAYTIDGSSTPRRKSSAMR